MNVEIVTVVEQFLFWEYCVFTVYMFRTKWFRMYTKLVILSRLICTLGYVGGPPPPGAILLK
jgi:hypothetical protein